MVKHLAKINRTDDTILNETWINQETKLRQNEKSRVKVGEKKTGNRRKKKTVRRS